MKCGCNEQLIQNVYQTGFALDDVVLFLDTHPTDQDAMTYYNYIKQAHQEAVQAYEQSCGPLTDGNVTSNQWDWVQGPWPWEGGRV